ncbi:DUF4012 domain-containing protein [Demequina sp. SYSU T00192]|uniref:DUF4012 domain-containing protein n=1 Tax=Demequina litoralis TaxID=3051660 RepID=A0ABT8G8G4_9MICO|nr:DUF4012 domain-containing protein [Demequina sp. SYSU T00192]MDN4475413.1 DUF4012 domain-containing protein [Demequina sp. SYSU T00192]
MADEPVAAPPRRRRRWPWLVAGGVMLAMAGLIALFAFDAWRLQGAADDLIAHAGGARDALEARDPAQLRAEVSGAEEAALAFDDATHGPHWWVASQVPWVKDQAVPLMTAGAAVRAVAEDALRPLAELDDLDVLEAPPIEDGRIDPFVLEEARPALEQAYATLSAQGEVLAAVDLSGTDPRLGAQYEQLEEQLATLADLVDGARVTAELLPGLLGGEGERSYLVMVQNNAEPRTTGGLPGAIIELEVDDGRMTMGRQIAARRLIPDEGRATITEDEERIFSERMAEFPHDANFTPEFPRTAEIMSDFWELEYGDRPDGVVSIDPVALGWMLEGAPPLETGEFTIESDNLAATMLNHAYFRYDDPNAQDAFFARTSGELFGRIVSGEAATLSGLERAIDARRFLVWSADAGEQELLAETPIAGAFLEDEGDLGVFLNDGSGSKIGYYVRTRVDVTEYVCTDGSLVGEEVAVTLSHEFDGKVKDLPDYVSGGGVYVPEGVFEANVVVYPAIGTTLVGMLEDGVESTAVGDVHDGREMSQKRVSLEPGESVTLTYQIRASEDGLVPPGVILTPGPHADQITRAAEPAEGC